MISSKSSVNLPSRSWMNVARGSWLHANSACPGSPTIVSQETLISLETYLCTREARYLRGAEQFRPLLDAFNGRQPNHRLHDIAIRHRDGFWFSRRQLWGDTFSHDWSALTGWVFYRYGQATGRDAYRRRGREILLNNLSAFRPDGRASCAFIYPDTVNGDPARCRDALANDQDWAMVLPYAGQADGSGVRRGASERATRSPPAGVRHRGQGLVL